MTGSLWTHELQHTRLHCPSLSPWVWSSSCPLSQLCYPTISSSVALFFSCPQFFPDWGSFPMSQLFILDGQSIGATASVLTLNIQGSFPLGLTGLISFKSINSLTLSLLCGPTLTSIQDYWKKPQLWPDGPLSAKWCLCSFYGHMDYDSSVVLL